MSSINRTSFLSVSVCLGLFLGCDKSPTVSIKKLDDLKRTIANQSTEEDKIDDGPNSTKDQTVNGVVTRLQSHKRKMIDSFASLYINRADLSMVYPGSLLWWDAVQGGNFDPVPGSPKKKFNCVVRQAILNDQGKHPSASFQTDGTLKDFQDQLAAMKLAGHSTGIDFEIISARSLKESMLKLGFSAQYLSFGGGSGSFNEQVKESRSVAVLSLRQTFFSVSVDPTSLPKGGILGLREFTSEEDAALAKSIGEKNSEIAYISDINYGRVVLLMVSSTASEKELKAALNANYNYFVSGDASMNLEQKELLKQCEAKCILIGNKLNKDEVAPVLTSNFESIADNVKKFMSDNSVLKDPSYAVPISMALRYTKDNATAKVSDMTEYSYWVPFESIVPEQLKSIIKNLRINPPARVASGDDEMDSGDSSARVSVSYHIIRKEQKNGVYIDVDMSAQEYDNEMKNKEDTRLTLSKRFSFDLAPVGTEIILLNDTNVVSNSRDFHGEIGDNDWNSFGHFGDASDISARWDADGDKDSTFTKLDMNLNLRYKIPAVVTPIDANKNK